jgi:hypothetical protein
VVDGIGYRRSDSDQADLPDALDADGVAWIGFADERVTRLSSRSRRELPLTRSVRSTSVVGPRLVCGMELIYPVRTPTDATMAGPSPLFGAAKPKD